MLVNTSPLQDIFNTEAYRNHEAGYQDRMIGQPLKSGSSDYVEGYMERVRYEIDHDVAMEQLASLEWAIHSLIVAAA